MTENLPFNALLRRLHADGEAHLVYERLRARLITFFRLHVPEQAESLADTTMERLGRRLQEGVIVDSVPLYALGVARLLVKEEIARRERERRVALESERQLALQADVGDNDAALAALAACLKLLGAEAADFILQYYGADGASRIAERQRLAATLGLSLNALRNRALRIRSRLEECTLGRLSVTKTTLESLRP